MISRVRGKLLRREPQAAEIYTAGGVAYEVAVPTSVYERLPKPGEEVELRTVHVVREDAVTLYGFLEEHERAVFTRVLSAGGIGPRTALQMLSAMPATRLVRAILEKDVASLRQVPGVGKKTAERLVLELADRMDDLVAAGAAAAADAPGRAAEDGIGALVALGYSPAQAAQAVRRALDEHGPLAGTDLIRAALAVAGR